MASIYGKKRTTYSSKKKSERKAVLVRVAKPKKKAYKRAKLTTVVDVRKHHYALSMDKDMENFYLQQSYHANIAWPLPAQDGKFANNNTDGFLISMNQLINCFAGQAGSLGSTHNGVPTATSSGTGLGIHATQYSCSGNYNSSSDLHIPNSLATIFTRYGQLCVTGGILKIRISQETPFSTTVIAQPLSMGTTKIAVCGFPSTPETGEILHSYGNGHWVYPYQSTTPTDQKDLQSFTGLCSEANAKVAEMTITSGSQSVAYITYPFEMQKYCPPGYWTSAAFYQKGIDNISRNPTYSYQPRFLIQLQTGGELDAQQYKLEMSMTWKVRAFERLPLIANP